MDDQERLAAEEGLLRGLKDAESRVKTFLSKRESGVAGVFDVLVQLQEDIRRHRDSVPPGHSSSALDKGLLSLEQLKMDVINAPHNTKRCMHSLRGGCCEAPFFSRSRAHPIAAMTG